MYQTYQIHIKRGHRLFSYCDEMCAKANNLYNTTNFFIRQVFTSFTEEQESLQPLQQEVFDLLEKHFSTMNQKKLDYVQKRRLKELQKPLFERKDIKEATLFVMPTKEKKMVSYGLLDALFKTMKHPDYLSLPGQVNQQVMRVVFQNWKSFFASIKDYKINPHKYSGRPRLPKYATKGGRKECTLSNQVCTIKEQKYLKLPLTSLQLNIGKLGAKGNLQQVRIIPVYGTYTVEVVVKEEIATTYTSNPEYVMGIDLGVNALATIVDNTGLPPVIIKGKAVKSMNQFYNKQRAHYMGILRHGKQAEEGAFFSQRLNRLDRKRHHKIKDYFHKASAHIIQIAQKRRIGTIVIGKNDQWKADVPLRKKDKQHFIFLPFNRLIQMIQYKAKRYGIEVIIHEESFTSQASFLDLDDIPTYGDCEEPASFSGKRMKRGLYRSKENIFLHADVNAAGNIIRKVVPHAFAKGIEGIVACPLMLSIL